LRQTSLHFKRSVERATSREEFHRREASLVNVHHRTESLATQSRVSSTLEVRRALISARHFSEITKHAAGEYVPRLAGSNASTILTTPQRFFQPMLLSPRAGVVVGSAAPFPNPAVVRGQIVESITEHRLAPRLRKSDPQPAAQAPIYLAKPAVEQVWRSAQPQSRKSSSETASSPSIAAPTAHPLPPHQKMDSPAAVPAAAAPAPVRFEGPAMDRLAEDVMKRIERHLRIERERRGI
jgi:hypothetical protein